MEETSHREKPTVSELCGENSFACTVSVHTVCNLAVAFYEYLFNETERESEHAWWEGAEGERKYQADSVLVSIDPHT